MGLIRKIVLFTTFGLIGGAALVTKPPERAYAGTYDISNYDITIDCSSGTQKVNGVEEADPVITGNSNIYKIVINTAQNCPSRVKLSSVTIIQETFGPTAFDITGDGDVVIELDGENILQSGGTHAGIEKNSTGFLEIGGTGALNVTGGAYGGAGIGGGYNRDGSNITITGGTITAIGGSDAGAGIGGGSYGSGSNITIKGGKVTATGGSDSTVIIGGAGIGGGESGEGSNIKITGGIVTATGGKCGAGIGGGVNESGSDITITGGTVIAVGGLCSSGIGGGHYGTGSVVVISNDAKVMASGGAATTYYSSDLGAGAAIGDGGGAYNTSGAEIEPDISGLNEAGFIKIYAPGATVDAIKNGTVAPERIITVTIPDPSPQRETPTEENLITVSDNKPMAVSTESRGEFKITYAHEIPFFGKGKITPEYFGGITVSQGNVTYEVTKIKVNKKKHIFQITELSGVDKDTLKKIKKATKGNNRLSFKCNPYYVRDTDKVTLKFKKSGHLKSVKILINSKEYKAKKDEYSYDSSEKQILFKGSNLNGSYQNK